MTFRPLLSATLEDPTTLKYPVLVSPKLDGIRCVILHGTPLTRTLKPIPNRHIRSALSGLPSLDGELIVGDPANPKTWNTTSSAVMSFDGEPDFTYYVFDIASVVESPLAFDFRLQGAASEIAGADRPFLKIVPHHLVFSVSELLEREEHYVALGYEGLMIRDPAGIYKHGRSTAREGILLKMKRWDDCEVEVVGFTERQTHVGEAKINALGLMERGHKKEDMAPAGDLGALVCRWYGKDSSIEFEIGTGFTSEQRVSFWQNQDKLKWKPVTMKHQGKTPDGKPRFPTFLRFRSEHELG
jgi:DNA ligase-1